MLFATPSHPYPADSTPFLHRFYACALVAGAVAWYGAILAEYAAHHERVEGQYPAPCSVMRRMYGYNYVLVALPIAVVMAAQMHALNSLGALGLSCVAEAAFLLAIAGYSQILRMHVACCVAAGLATTLVCINVGPAHGLIAGVPLLTLALVAVALHFAVAPREDADHPNTWTSIVFFLLDLWLVMARISIATIPASRNWVDHFALDVAAAAIVVGTGIVAFVADLADLARLRAQGLLPGDDGRRQQRPANDAGRRISNEPSAAGPMSGCRLVMMVAPQRGSTMAGDGR